MMVGRSFDLRNAVTVSGDQELGSSRNSAMTASLCITEPWVLKIEWNILLEWKLSIELFGFYCIMRAW